MSIAGADPTLSGTLLNAPPNAAVDPMANPPPLYPGFTKLFWSSPSESNINIYMMLYGKDLFT